MVTGPGIADGEEPSYADPGPAISRSLTAASKAAPHVDEGTWYVRDAVTDEVIGYSEVYGTHLVRTVDNRKGKKK